MDRLYLIYAACGLPLVGIAVAVVLESSSPGDVAGRLAWEVLGGTLLGMCLGALAGWAMQAAIGQRDLDKGAELVFTLLLAVAVLGVARLPSTGGVLAVFLAGLAYNRAIGSDERGQQASIDEAVNRYAVLPLFLLLGVVLPWADWAAFGPIALLFVSGVLLLRRLPLILLLGDRSSCTAERHPSSAGSDPWGSAPSSTWHTAGTKGSQTRGSSRPARWPSPRAWWRSASRPRRDAGRSQVAVRLSCTRRVRRSRTRRRPGGRVNLHHAHLRPRLT